MSQKRIHGYELETTYLQRVEMPSGARILSAQAQGGKLRLWVLASADPGRPTEKRLIRIFGTGYPCDAYPADYVATVQIDGQAWHVFDEGESEND